MEKSNIFLNQNAIYVLIECDLNNKEPKYCRGTISGILFLNEIYSLNEIPKEAISCKSFLEVHQTYYK